MIHNRHMVLCVSVLTLGCLSLCVPSANAGSKPAPGLKMLPNVGCQGLLTNADFPGTVSESTVGGGVFGSVEAGRSGSSGFFTSCQFNPPEPTESDPTPDKNVGADELGVEPRGEFETRGRRHNLLSAFPSTPESSRYQLHGVGTRAYFIINNEGGTVGYLQVRNDVFIVAKEEVAGIKELLATVASELCKSCSEAEIPQPRKPNPGPVRIHN